MTALEQLIAASLARCDRLSMSVEELRPLLAPHLPAAAGTLEQLPLVERIASVALLKRVEQMQDLIARLVRLVAAWELVEVDEMTRRDLANWMEKVGMVPDADIWTALSALRNRLVHEYPIDEAEQADRINQSWAATSELQRIASAIADYLETKGFAA